MIDMQENKITYFGHSTFSLTTSSGQIGLIDPFVMSNPHCPEALKKIPRLDIIFIYHGHSDQIGDLLPLAKQHQPKTVAIFETCLWLGRKVLNRKPVRWEKVDRRRLTSFMSP
jgi:L-ascorbate metabolism protein UlaG (beta-lactamase superfamily)